MAGARDKGDKADKAIVKRLERLVTLPDSEWEGGHDLWAHKVWGRLAELFSILASLEAKQAPLSTWIRPRTDHTVSDFRGWLRDKGGFDLDHFPVDIRVSGDAGELIATTDVTKGTELLRIPERVMLTEKHIPGLLQGDAMLRRMPHLGVAVYIALQMSDSSGPVGDGGFRPFLSMFPSSFTSALQLDLAGLRSLQGSDAQMLAIRRLRSHARQYCYLRGVLSRMGATPGRALNYSLFTWAVSAVATRQNAIPVHGSADGETCVAMIPVWDMANQPDDLSPFAAVGEEDEEEEEEGGEVYGMTTSFHAADRELTFTAMEDAVKGSPIRMFYGPRGNRALLLHAGFMSANNPFDTVDVMLPIHPCPLLPLRLHALRKLGLAAGSIVESTHVPVCLSARRPRTGEGGARAWPDDALRVAEVLVMDREGAGRWLRAETDEERSAAVGSAWQTQAARLLSNSIRERMGRYDSARVSRLCKLELELLESFLPHEPAV